MDLKRLLGLKKNDGRRTKIVEEERENKKRIAEHEVPRLPAVWNR